MIFTCKWKGFSWTQVIKKNEDRWLILSPLSKDFHKFKLIDLFFKEIDVDIVVFKNLLWKLYWNTLHCLGYLKGKTQLLKWLVDLIKVSDLLNLVI